MAFKVSMLVSADAAQAKKELAATKKAVTDTGKATEKLGKRGKSAATGTKILASSAAKATADVRALAAAERAATGNALKLGGANRLAAGQVGNLTAQFNDIGVMLAAGQNPLQLALQQGTQITQVIGPMGAAGAAKALSSAFFQMLNPISLITIGSIAAGAALFNWLRGGREGARTFEDAISDLDDAVEAYRKNARAAGADTIDLAERFGAGADSARRYLQAIAEVKRREALIAAAEVTKKLTGGDGSYRQASQVRGIAEQFDLEVGGIAGNRRKMARQLTGAVILAYEELDQVAGKSVGEQIAAWERLFGSTKSAAEAVGGVTVEENQLLKVIAEQILRLTELKAVDEATARADDEKLKNANEMLAVLNGEVAVNALILGHGRKSAEVFNFRLEAARKLYELKVKELPLAKTLMAAWDVANQRRDPQVERIQNAYTYLGISRQQGAVAANAAQVVLDGLRAENALQEAIRRKGAQSVEVANMRAVAERLVFENMVASLDVAESLKDEMRAAFEHGQDLSQTDLSTGVNSAAEAAASLAKRLGISLDLATRLGGKLGGPRDDPTRSGRFEDLDPRSGKGMWTGGYSRSWNPGKGRALGSGSEKQVSALTRLISKERAELAILRTLDPVQKELLKNREALAGASQVELQLVESLISARIREGLGMEALQESYDFFGSTSNSFFDDLLIKGKDLDDIIGNLASSLASAALEATWLGTGPLASLFGTTDSGGLFSSLFGAIFKAEGGIINGPGGPTEDKVPVWASSGEFMVRASQTTRHRALLEAINSGEIDRIPAFAAGGIVGPITSAPPVFARTANRTADGRASDSRLVVDLRLSDDLDARIDERSGDVAVKVTRAGIENFSDEGLPRRVLQISEDRRAIG